MDTVNRDFAYNGQVQDFPDPNSSNFGIPLVRRQGSNKDKRNFPTLPEIAQKCKLKMYIKNSIRFFSKFPVIVGLLVCDEHIPQTEAGHTLTCECLKYKTNFGMKNFSSVKKI